MSEAAPRVRPGWDELREAADQLHAAELIVGDPVARPPSAIVHLREFWRLLTRAGIAAGIGKRDAGDPDPDPKAWLQGELPDLDERERQTLLAQLRALAGERPPSKRELRAQVAAARSLLARIEPELVGEPLYRRKRRALWASVAVAVLVMPLLVYVALHLEIPGTGPWRAAYYANTKFDGEPVVVREASIEHDWKESAPVEQLAPDKYSVRWDTCLRVDETGPVVFQVNADEGARVLIDGETVIDAWDENPTTGRRGFGSVELELSAGVHHLRVEYFEKLKAAHIKLSASLDGSLPRPLSRDHLSYPGDEFDEQDPCAAR